MVHNLGDETALVKVCFDDMTPLKVAGLFTQLDEWLANGCDNAGFETIDDQPHCVFTAPLDSMYTLMYTIDGKGTPTVIAKGENVNAIRGIMLDRYVHIRDGEYEVRRSVIKLNSADIIFEDGAGKFHTMEWFIHREIIREV